MVNIKSTLLALILITPMTAMATDRVEELEKEIDDLKIRVAVLERLIDIKLPEKTEAEAFIELLMFLQEQSERENEAANDPDTAELDEALSDSLESELAYEKSVTDAQAVMSALAYIQDEIRKRWIRPANARAGMLVELRIHLVPTGEVVNMEVTYQKDASKAFVHSVQKAIKTVGRFDKLSGLDPVLFDANFRTFKIIFRPEDLRL